MAAWIHPRHHHALDVDGTVSHQQTGKRDGGGLDLLLEGGCVCPVVREGVIEEVAELGLVLGGDGEVLQAREGLVDGLERLGGGFGRRGSGEGGGWGGGDTEVFCSASDDGDEPVSNPVIGPDRDAGGGGGAEVAQTHAGDQLEVGVLAGQEVVNQKVEGGGARAALLEEGLRLRDLPDDLGEGRPVGLPLLENLFVLPAGVLGVRLQARAVRKDLEEGWHAPRCHQVLLEPAVGEVGQDYGAEPRKVLNVEVGRHLPGEEVEQPGGCRRRKGGRLGVWFGLLVMNVKEIER